MAHRLALVCEDVGEEIKDGEKEVEKGDVLGGWTDVFGGRAGRTSGQTELSLTSPLTESSCRESWLAGWKKPVCMVWLWPRGVPQGSMPGGEGASSGVRKW